jgi:putative oxidoreductase
MAMCAGPDHTGTRKLKKLKKLNNFFETKKDYGAIFLRVIIGWRLLAGVWPYVSQARSINEVKTFFIQLFIPLPLWSAYISVYVQFICGILVIAGLWIRPAALLMIINFSVAILAGHLNDGIEKSFAAWIILAASFFFLFYGPGKLAMDKRKNQGY